MAIEMVSFPINSMVDLSIAMLNYQKVNPIRSPLNHHKITVFSGSITTKTTHLWVLVSHISTYTLW